VNRDIQICCFEGFWIYCLLSCVRKLMFYRKILPYKFTYFHTYSSEPIGWEMSACLLVKYWERLQLRYPSMEKKLIGFQRISSQEAIMPSGMYILFHFVRKIGKFRAISWRSDFTRYATWDANYLYFAVEANEIATNDHDILVTMYLDSNPRPDPLSGSGILFLISKYYRNCCRVPI
jgi:hypothetical protein